MTQKIDWEEYYAGKKNSANNISFSDIFDRYLYSKKYASVLEIGCAGGEYLYHLAKRFGYEAWGIDYSDKIEMTRKIFKDRGLPEPNLIKGNFLSWQINRKFDVVCSFGFIEHFNEPENVIKKHIDLTSKGGIVILSLPHFAHFQFLFHWMLDKDNLRKHNIKIMNVKSIRKILADMPVEILYLNYYKTFGFWTERKKLNFLEKAAFRLIRLFGKAINFTLGYDRPNFMFSPHIICVARKI